MAARALSHLGLAGALLGVEHLALEVAQVDHVRVDDAQRAHARGGEVERGGRAQPARAQQQHLGLEQLRLTLLADLGEDEVAAVALLLGGGEHQRLLHRVGASLQRLKPPGHARPRACSPCRCSVRAASAERVPPAQ